MDKTQQTQALNEGWLPANEVINMIMAVSGTLITEQLHLVISPQEVLDMTRRVMLSEEDNCPRCGHVAFMHDGIHNCVALTDVVDPGTGLPSKCGCLRRYEGN